MSDGGISQRKLSRRRASECCSEDGNNTVNRVTNATLKFLLLVKSGLPNFASFPFVFVLRIIFFLLNKRNSQQ